MSSVAILFSPALQFDPGQVAALQAVDEDLGGAEQISSMIACGEIDMLLFFRDPVNARPNEPNAVTLLRLCDTRAIPVATNIATAEVLIHGLERGDLAWIELQRGRK